MVNVEAIHLPFPQMIKIFSVKSAKNNIFIEKKSLDSIVSNQIRLDVTGSGVPNQEWTILLLVHQTLPKHHPFIPT